MSRLQLARAPYRIIEIADPYTKAEGLGKFFAEHEKLRHAFADVTAAARRGQIPLKGARLLILGSFATSSGAIRAALSRNAAALAAFVKQGGTVAVLAQLRADEGRATFLPKALKAERGDANYDETMIAPTPYAKRHPLWRTPHNVQSRALGKWKPKEPKWDYPSGVGAATGAFRSLTGFATLAARNSAGAHPSLVEAAHGRGRYLLSALLPDKVIGTNGNGRATDAAEAADAPTRDAKAWLENLVAYADLVALGRAPAIAAAPPTTGATVAVEVQVTGAPASGVAVSDGTRFVETDSTGVARFVYPDDARVTLSVVAPPGFDVVSPVHRTLSMLPRGTPAPESPEALPQQVNFAIAPHETPQPIDYTFAVITDVHLGARDLARDTESFTRRLTELWAATPRPDFLLSLGDVSAYAKEAEFTAYLRALAATLPTGDRAPRVVSVIGNHDETFPPDRSARFETSVAPAFQVFHRGTPQTFDRFIVGADFPGAPERRAWLLAALDLAPRPRRTFIVQHHYPSRALIKLVKGRADALLSGDWHAARVTRDSGVLNINTAPFTFGGMDQTPAGFRLISVSGAAGTISSRYRYGLIERRADIVEPTATSSCRAGTMPIMVAANDSRAQVARVSFRLMRARKEHAEALLGSGELSPFGTGIWRGAWDCAPSTELDADLVVTVEDVRGAVWSAKRSVKLKSSESRVAALGTFRFRRAPLSDAVSPPLMLTWIASTGGEAGPSQPAIGRGLVFVARAERDDVDRSRGALLAFDRTSGEHRWTFHADASIESSPATDAHHVYVTTVRGVMHALRQSDGAPLWKYDLNQPGRSKYESRLIYQSPVAVGGGVLTGAAQHLVRLSAANGRPDWSQSPIGNDHLPNFAHIAVAGQRLFVPSYSEGLHAIDSMSGAILWRTGRGRVMATPAIQGDTVYFIEQHRLRALSVFDGRQRWQVQLGPGHHSAGPVANDDAVFVADIHGNVVSFRAKDGRRNWSTRASRTALVDVAPYQRREGGGITATPVLSGATLWVGAHDGNLVAIDAETGRILDRRALGAPILAPPTIVGEMLFVATQAGSLFAFRATPADAPKRKTPTRVQRWRAPRRS